MLQPPQQPVHAPGGSLQRLSTACTAGRLAARPQPPHSLHSLGCHVLNGTRNSILAVHQSTLLFLSPLQEYLNDYGSEEAKRVGEELIERERVIGLSDSAQVRGAVLGVGRPRMATPSYVHGCGWTGSEHAASDDFMFWQQ